MNPALMSLRIASYIYFFLAVVLLGVGIFGENFGVMFVMSLFMIGWGYFLLRIRRGLMEGKYWAWVAGIIVSGMQLLSIFLPLGLMGLIGLLNAETRRAFNSIADAKTA